MENPTTNTDNLVEVMTELTISDVKLLCQLVAMCINVELFTDESKSSLESISLKLEKLSQDLEK
jgi:hypothetical protein